MIQNYDYQSRGGPVAEGSASRLECVRREKTLRGSMHYADRRAGAELAVAFKLFCAARQNAVLRRSPFPSP